MLSSGQGALLRPCDLLVSVGPLTPGRLFLGVTGPLAALGLLLVLSEPPQEASLVTLPSQNLSPWPEFVIL